MHLSLNPPTSGPEEYASIGHQNQSQAQHQLSTPTHQHQHPDQQKMMLIQQKQPPLPDFHSADAPIPFGVRFQPGMATTAAEESVVTPAPQRWPCAQVLDDLKNPKQDLETPFNQNGQHQHSQTLGSEHSDIDATARRLPRTDATFLDVYTLAGKLGEGQGNAVMRCVHNESGKEYAVKFFQDTRAARAEYKTHLLCDGHPLIVSIVEAFLQSTPPSPPKPLPAHRIGQRRRAGSAAEGTAGASAWMIIVLELAHGGDLFDRLASSPNGRFSEAVAKMYTYQLASILAHCHSKGVVHRDIKPENIAFANDGHEIRLIDFGFATDETPKQGKYTAAYIAPEILKSMASRRRSGKWLEYTDAVDMWSLGATLYTLLSGFSPFYSSKRRRPSEIPPDMREMIYRASMTFPKAEWAHCSEGAIQIVRKMLTPNANARITAKELLEHSWTAAGATDLVTKAIIGSRSSSDGSSGDGNDRGAVDGAVDPAPAPTKDASADAAGAGAAAVSSAEGDGSPMQFPHSDLYARAQQAFAAPTLLATMPTTPVAAGKAAAASALGEPVELVLTTTTTGATATATPIGPLREHNSAAMDTLLDDLTPETQRPHSHLRTWVDDADVLLEDQVKRRLMLTPTTELSTIPSTTSVADSRACAEKVTARAAAAVGMAAASAAANVAGLSDAFAAASAAADASYEAAELAAVATAAMAMASVERPAVAMNTAMDEPLPTHHKLPTHHTPLRSLLSRSLNRSDASSPFRSDSDRPSDNDAEAPGITASYG